MPRPGNLRESQEKLESRGNRRLVYFLPHARRQFYVYPGKRPRSVRRRGNGEIKVASELDRGSIFSVKLRKCDIKKGDFTQDMSFVSEPYEPEHITFLEDGPIITQRFNILIIIRITKEIGNFTGENVILNES